MEPDMEKKIISHCPVVITYIADREMIGIRNKIVIPPEHLIEIRKKFLIDVEVVKVFEAQPKLPYKFPYSYDSPNPVQCNSLPTLHTGVTLIMVKKQYNEVSQFLGLGIQFPEVEYNYTMLYIILLLIVVVVVAVIYAMSRPSKPGKQPKQAEYYY